MTEYTLRAGTAMDEPWGTTMLLKDDRRVEIFPDGTVYLINADNLAVRVEWPTDPDADNTMPAPAVFRTDRAASPELILPDPEPPATVDEVVELLHTNPWDAPDPSPEQPPTGQLRPAVERLQRYLAARAMVKANEAMRLDRSTPTGQQAAGQSHAYVNAAMWLEDLFAGREPQLPEIG